MHYYNYRKFSLEQEQAMRDKQADGLYIEEFLTDKEFNLLKKIFDKHTNWNEIGTVSKYHGFDINTEYGPLLKWLIPKIDNIITDWEVDFITLQEAIIPWKVHADLRWSNNKIPYRMFLIPVDVVPESEVTQSSWLDTYTITFKQRNYLSNYDKDLNLDSYGNNNSYVYPKNDPSVENLVEGYTITKEQWHQYFSHMPYEFLEGLEIDKILKWKPRSLIAWDMSTLHCADNFVSQAIKTKKCLMVATVLKINYIVDI